MISASRFEFHSVKGMEMRDGILLVAGKKREGDLCGVYWTPYVDDQVVEPQLLGERTWDGADNSVNHDLVGRIVNRDVVVIGQGGRIFVEPTTTTGALKKTEELCWPEGLWKSRDQVTVLGLTSCGDRLAVTVSANDKAFLIVWEWNTFALLCIASLGEYSVVRIFYVFTSREHCFDFVHSRPKTRITQTSSILC